MDTKHTPGPWHWVNPDNDEPAMPSANSGYGSLRTVEEFGEDKREERDGKFYTSFRLPKFILTTEEISDEDARLIAAAPELLQELDRIADNMAFVLNHAELGKWYEKFSTELEQARAAIAKATQP